MYLGKKVSISQKPPQYTSASPRKSFLLHSPYSWIPPERHQSSMTAWPSQTHSQGAFSFWTIWTSRPPIGIGYFPEKKSEMDVVREGSWEPSTLPKWRGNQLDARKSRIPKLCIPLTNQAIEFRQFRFPVGFPRGLEKSFILQDTHLVTCLLA